jgi:AAA domain-containing protein
VNGSETPTPLQWSDIGRDAEKTAAQSRRMAQEAQAKGIPLPKFELPRETARDGTPKPAEGFQLVGLGELLSRPEIPLDWVWQGHLAAGTVSAVVSKPKVGKSTFARNLCLAVARDQEYLGFHTGGSLCVYLALEERVEDVTADSRALGADGNESILIHADSTPAAGIVALVEIVKEKKPRLVVIDPLFRMVRVRDEKAYAETYAALGPLIDLASSTGTHVLLTHHSGKAMKIDAIDSPLGSTAIGGAVSTLIVLKRTDRYRTIQTVQRIGQDLPETVLEFNPERKRLSIGGTREEADRGDCEGRILEFLKEAPEPQTQAQIRAEVEGKTKIIRAALTALVGSGKLKKSGDGAKGKPFFYEFEDSGSQYIAGTREPECRKAVETRINTDRILVPTLEQKPILVPEKKQVPERAILTPENGSDGLEL